MITTATFACASSCTLNTIKLSFGSYDTLKSSETFGTGGISVTCEGVYPGIYIIKLGPGPYSNGEFSPRRMQAIGGGGFLNYYIYRDASFSQIWGDGTAGSYVHTGGADETHQIYGMIPPLQNVEAGSYEDSITVTVEF